ASRGLGDVYKRQIYTFRLIFVAFHGEPKTEAHAGHGISHWLPLSVLIVLSTFVGALITPPLAGVLPESVGHAGGEAKHSLELASGAIAIAGILLAALLFLGQRRFVSALAKSAPGRFFGTWWYHAWGFDWLYDKLFVKPYLLLCQLLGRDPIDRTLGVVPFSVRGGHNLLSLTENGRLRWYAASLVGGAAILLGALLLA
ncbi:NADH-quinone oxidoreductase subunit L, partial [Pseudomonas aeruginosa]|nr:NADH-quinone oxidoreductase subunit L [Pseudomonas aeruginosa]